VDALTPPSTRRRSASRACPCEGGGRLGGSAGGGLWFEAVDQILEVVHEFRIVEVRLVAGEGDDTTIAVDRLLVVAFGLMEPPDDTRSRHAH
jgi:hypothetical protein